MVYESDFYTTRRYRTSPSLSTYTSSNVVSKQVRIVPSLGKIHIVHSCEPYDSSVAQRRLRVLATPPSKLRREYERIENLLRPHIGYSAQNRFLDSRSNVLFDDETRLIRAKSASLLKRIHAPVPRVQKLFPITSYRYEELLPARLTNDNYINRMLVTSARNPRIEYTTYWTEPTRKYIGQGHLSCVSYAGNRAYPRRRNVWLYEDPLRSDIQLLSYYIEKFRQEKGSAKIKEIKEKEVKLNPNRPSRRFSNKVEESSEELKQLREERAKRLERIYETEKKTEEKSLDEELKLKKIEEEKRILLEEQKKKEEEKKREREEERIKKQQQQQLEQEEREERKRLEEEAKLKKQQEEEEEEEERQRLEEEEERIKKQKQEEEEEKEAERKRIEEEQEAERKRIQEEEEREAELLKKQLEEEERLKLKQKLEEEEEELKRLEEEKQHLIRLEELAKQAEDEKEQELKRQAEELAELAKNQIEEIEEKQEISEPQPEKMEEEEEEEEEKEKFEEIVPKIDDSVIGFNLEEETDKLEAKLNELAKERAQQESDVVEEEKEEEEEEAVVLDQQEELKPEAVEEEEEEDPVAICEDLPEQEANSDEE
ncbi:golgin subfamily A member 6-like protein 22 isoform X2 [Aethina tumida]|uniref:golgin subfamily A member 6-like protein 22 isoform X2 n=1 Tax=Aethina tumida TaxID=116153 RepID=UPI002148F755|nr:golgin subfamily A member 6-like protein 22 isoform X2 [Aethina tumida]